MIAVDLQTITLKFNQQTLFANLNLTLHAGKWVALLGASGVGKTSLLRILAGITNEEETVEGSITTGNGKPYAEQIAYMAQTDLLLPWLTAFDNATLGLRLRSTSYETRQEKYTFAHELFNQVGLKNAKKLYPRQLSGGMRQRVALIRTLLEDKPIVLMDEPFSALDAITRYELQALAYELLKDKTILFVTHDPQEALRIADHVYVMSGQPAQLELVATLETTAPRDFNTNEVIHWQKMLFDKLSVGKTA